jgi:hypothetical protein
MVVPREPESRPDVERELMSLALQNVGLIVPHR